MLPARGLTKFLFWGNTSCNLYAVAYTASFDLLFFTSCRKIAEKILTDREKYIENPESIFDYLTTKEGFHDEISVEKIIAILALQEKDIFNTLLNKELGREFNGQIRNMYEAPTDTGSIELIVKQKKLSITVSDNKKVQYLEECKITTEAIYIDHPYLLDNLDNKSFFGERMRNHLYSLKKYCSRKEKPAR